MNRIEVGNAPSPNLKKVTSKIGSLENAQHKPGEFSLIKKFQLFKNQKGVHGFN